MDNKEEEKISVIYFDPETQRQNALLALASKTELDAYEISLAKKNVEQGREDLSQFLRQLSNINFDTINENTLIMLSCATYFKLSCIYGRFQDEIRSQPFPKNLDNLQNKFNAIFDNIKHDIKVPIGTSLRNSIPRIRAFVEKDLRPFFGARDKKSREKKAKAANRRAASNQTLSGGSNPSILLSSSSIAASSSSVSSLPTKEQQANQPTIALSTTNTVTSSATTTSSVSSFTPNTTPFRSPDTPQSLTVIITASPYNTPSSPAVTVSATPMLLATYNSATVSCSYPVSPYLSSTCSKTNDHTTTATPLAPLPEASAQLPTYTDHSSSTSLSHSIGCSPKLPIASTPKRLFDLSSFFATDNSSPDSSTSITPPSETTNNYETSSTYYSNYSYAAFFTPNESAVFASFLAQPTPVHEAEVVYDDELPIDLSFL